jgi:beta-lactamase class A
VPPVTSAGLWQRSRGAALPVRLAVLAAAASDAAAANALLERVGLAAVRARMDDIGLEKTALIDGSATSAGPTTHRRSRCRRGELSALFAAIVNAQVVSPAVSAQVGEWLNLNQDLALVAAATALDPFAHETTATAALRQQDRSRRRHPRRGRRDRGPARGAPTR